jgi:UDP-GlcNAc:undecaprenyl-phosphate GlcNAc-1-phosphate transferase
MESIEIFAGRALFWQWALVALSLGLAALLAHSFTPVAIRIAGHYGLVDKPDGKLKTHKEAVPYLGGMAVYLAFLLTLAMTYTFNQEVLALLLAGTIIVLLGLVDDIGALSPRAKFLGQSLAILALMKAGILIEIIYLPWYVTYPLTYLWLLGITNAFNIIDIMDGLSAGVGLIGALTLLGVAVMNGNVQIAVITAALTGSLLGFLRFNSVPARIYLGDTGSLFIGLNLGALAMIGSYTERNPLAVLVPVIILGVPIFDTFFVMYIRRRRGISMFLGSPDHFALRLRAWALTERQTVLWSYAVAAVLSAAGVAVMHLRWQEAALVLALLTCAALGAALWLKRIKVGL